MENKKTIEALNTLITINNDRIQGYETAAKETEEQDLKAMFGRFTATSQKCKVELVAEISKLGGQSDEGTLLSGKFFRVWMDVKAAITGKDRKAILNSCEFGEDEALKTYNEVLNDCVQDLTVEHQTLLNAQRFNIKADHDVVKAMRDTLLAV